MRILFAFTGGRGHLEPLVPIARAAKLAGHAVAFAAAPSPTLEELGFEAILSATGRSNTPPERTPLRAVDMERERQEFRERFADSGARMRADRVLEVVPRWRPDVVVVEETDFGSMIVAERVGVPHATVLVLAAGSFVTPELVAEPLDALRAEYGLAPDPELEMLDKLVLSPFPPSFRDPRFPLPATAHSFRGLDVAPNGPDEGPLVYFTLGTVFNLECGDLFARVFAALRELPVDVVATLGPHIDPSEFGALPGNFLLEEFLPQELVLPRARAVIAHGGSGTLVGALAYGLPQVLIPMGADQPLNAARAEALGFARVLDPVSATPETIRDAVGDVLSDPTYRAAAESLRDEIAALPGPESAFEQLERLC